MNEFPQFLAGCRLWVFLLVLGLLFSAVTFAQTAQRDRQQAVELSRNKSWDQAIASYRKALDLEPNDPDTHYNLALTLKYKGDAKQAVEEFEATLRLKPKWADAHYGLGATWFDLHDQAAALKELHTAIDLDPANVGAHRLLARIYLQQNDPAAAERELRRALQSKPSAEMHLELGLAEGQLGNLAAAAAEFHRALRLNPRYAPAHSLLGVTLRRQGDHAAALAEFRRAVEIDLKDPEAQYNLGMELKSGGNTAGAISAFLGPPPALRLVSRHMPVVEGQSRSCFSRARRPGSASTRVGDSGRDSCLCGGLSPVFRPHRRNDRDHCCSSSPKTLVARHVAGSVGVAQSGATRLLPFRMEDSTAQ